jgi:hypothetical protein
MAQRGASKIKKEALLILFLLLSVPLPLLSVLGIELKA